MKFKKILNSKDYSKLPLTRREQLNDILHNEFFLVVDISLLNLLFSLPLLIVLYLEYSFISSLTSFTFDKVFPLVFYFGLIALIPFGIRGIGKMASSAIYKKRIFNEGCLLIPTFFKNIKEEGIKGFINYLLLGISYLVATSGSIYFLYLDGNSIVKGFGIGVLVFYFFLRYVASNYFNNINNLYALRFVDANKNAYLFTFLSFIVSLFYFVIGVVIPAILIIISPFLIILVVVVYFMFYDGFLSLIASLYSYSRFDIYINKENYVELVNKGLRGKED